jgi:hypothetical protein
MIIDKLQGYLPVSVERQFLHDFQDQLQISHICFLSSKIPGFRRVGFPEKTAGNSRVLPSAHFADLCCFLPAFLTYCHEPLLAFMT